VVLQNSRRQDHAACLALLQCANTPEGLERLMEEIAIDLAEQGIHQVVAPTGLSAYLETGALQNNWDRLPPLNTPYHPPYMAELLESLMDPFAETRLYHLPVPGDDSSQGYQGGSHAGYPDLRFIPLNARRWSEEIPSMLFQAACPAWGGFRTPDEAEISYLKRRAAQGPVLGWLAQVAGQTAGFALLQPDLSALMKRTKGGNGMFGQILLQIGKRLPARAGRVLYGGVLPGWRRHGIGSELLSRAFDTARQKGWRSLIIGPLPAEWQSGAFLEKYGATAEQTYRLYRRDLL
jgi:GNAT superfamily N-acetyltransferase